MKLAVIGSSLSSIGVLASLERSGHEIVQFKGGNNSQISGFHRIYLSNMASIQRNLIISRSAFNLTKLSKKFFSTYNYEAGSNQQMMGQLVSLLSGGLSNFWGGACHPLLEDENDLFLSYGIDVKGSLPWVLDYIGQGTDRFDSSDYEYDFSKSVQWRRTFKLRGSGVEALNALAVLEKKNHLKLDQFVSNIIHNDKNVTLITHNSIGEEMISHYDHVFVAAGVLGSSVVASKMANISLNGVIHQNDQSIFFAKYSFKKKHPNIAKSTAAPSLLVKLNEDKFYVQLYPVKSFYPLVFEEGNCSGDSGYLFGYLYAEQEKSSSIRLDESDGVLNFNTINARPINGLVKKSIAELLKDEGIHILYGILDLGVGSSQHFSSVLAKNNKESKVAIAMEKYLDNISFERVHFADSSIFPKTPLCTIGLHSIASAYSITNQIIKNI
jgi:hypothetical protein